MELIFLATLTASAFWLVRHLDQRRRIALLASHLGQFQIEKHMETLTQGYLRALGEDNPARQDQILELLRPTELALCSQFARLATSFAKAGAVEARISKLPVDLPFAARLMPPQASFDMRQALALHARGIQLAVDRGDGSRRSRAFTVSAELFLMQHTCHWFCKSKTVASARMLARHKTSYQQLLAAVVPETRSAYSALVGGN